MRNISKPLIAVMDFQESRCEPRSGRILAEQLAIRFDASGFFHVADREVWLQKLGGVELSQECRFHPGWAADMVKLVNTDAMVLGRVGKSAGGKLTITAIALDSKGIALVTVERGNVDDLASLLLTKRRAKTIQQHLLLFQIHSNHRPGGYKMKRKPLIFLMILTEPP